MKLSLVFVCIALIGTSLCTQCLNANGSPVDWWVILKVPYMSSSSDPAVAAGYAFSYADANSPTLKYSGKRLDTDTSGALANTLNQIYKGSPSSVGWLMYNDQTPDDSVHSSYGHTKGDVAFDSKGGYWLVHSVPRWPNAYPASYNFPDYEKTYGQSFLCVSLGLSEINSVGGNFLLNKPYVYSSNMPSASLNSSLPNIVSVLNKKWITPAGSATVNMKTKGGLQLKTFAKNSNWNSTLWEAIVEPGIKSGMLIESWQNGSGGVMNSYCTPQYAYDSMNIETIQLTSTIGWPQTKDHSKWGISSDSGNWVCIGDINRMESQNSRGGGSCCFQLSSLFSSFKSIVSSAEYCP